MTRKYIKNIILPSTGESLEEITEWTPDDYLEETLKRLEALQKRVDEIATQVGLK